VSFNDLKHQQTRLAESLQVKRFIISPGQTAAYSVDSKTISAMSQIQHVLSVKLMLEILFFFILFNRLILSA